MDKVLTSRIVINQFPGQIVTVFYIRKSPELSSRMKFCRQLYPLPTVIAFLGWPTVFLTSEKEPLLYGVSSLVAGLVAFVIWDRK